MPLWLLVSTLLFGATPEDRRPSEIDEVVELIWETREAAACDAEGFESHLAELLAEVPTTSQERLRVEIRLDTDDKGAWSLDLWLGEAPRGHRRFESKSCHEVVEAAALIVAMELNPSSLGDAGDPKPREQPPSSTPDASKADDVSTDVETPPRDPGAALSDVELGIRVSGGVMALALPGVTGSFAGGLVVGGERWRVGLSARYRLPTRAELGSAGGRFSYLTARATGCGVLRSSALQFPLCAAVELGRIRARGIGVDRSRLARRPWIAVRAVPGLSYGLTGWLRLLLELDLGFVISQERYHLAGIGAVHEIGLLELGTMLSLEFRIHRGAT